MLASRKKDPVGIWSCVTCRQFPKNVTNELAALKNDLNVLKQSTNSILTAVNNLTSNIDRSIGNLNDKITALNNQVSNKDKSISDTLEILSTSTDSIKANINQKTCQNLNKTSAVLDKVKTSHNELSKQAKAVENSKYTNSSILHKPNELTAKSQLDTQNVKSVDKPQMKWNKRPNKTQNQQLNKAPKIDNKNKQQTNVIETIDLTKPQKRTKTIKHATLLAGSSILKNVQTNKQTES